jgi:hypothetical protein
MAKNNHSGGEEVDGEFIPKMVYNMSTIVFLSVEQGSLPP